MQKRGQDSERKALGARGEEEAAEYLVRKGYRILARAFRAPPGEIDIIAEKDETTVFVEVKTRKSVRFGLPVEAVTPRKRERIIRTALIFLQKKNLMERRCRFDIISIMKDSSGSTYIDHLESAFTAESAGG